MNKKDANLVRCENEMCTISIHLNANVLFKRGIERLREPVRVIYRVRSFCIHIWCLISNKFLNDDAGDN